MATILIVDDDTLFTTMLTRKLSLCGHEVQQAVSLKTAESCLNNDAIDLVLLDVHLPDGNGLDFLARVNNQLHSPEVIIVTGSGDPDGAELAIKNGAWDYIQKGDTLTSFILPIERALEHRRLKACQDPLYALKRESIIGDSPVLRNCLNLVYKGAQNDMSILITGETGTGKELIAWCLHNNSRRAQRNFVVVDCAALPENLVESLLFGHTRGSFTGADKDRMGLIQQAHGGTLFLDEVGELPLQLQKSFLRALQEHRFRPIGAEKEVESDFRLVAATNRDLDQMADEGLFRTDLLFRIRSLVIDLPPLRERADDIQLLVTHFLDKISVRQGGPRKNLSPEYVTMLTTYPWHGNIRELISCLEWSVVTAGGDQILMPHHLPQEIRVACIRSSIKKMPSPAFLNLEDEGDGAEGEDTYPSLEKVRWDTEQKYLQDVLKYCQGDIKKALTLSGLSRSRFYALLTKYQIPT